ncbi:MAG: hypothetical protein M3Q89_09180 [Verrucomicrobiota bacterium]|nr:hypothetical protein [Verrucomicrobiota bacterium]
MKVVIVSFALILSLSPAEAETKKREIVDAKPQYGGWGFDRDGADTKTNPGEIFSATPMARGSIACKSRATNLPTVSVSQ